VIYLDNNATTQVDPAVFEKMKPYFLDHFYNASSNTHSLGIQVKNAVEESRELIAELFHRNPQEIIFTSGSTESINLALKGIFHEVQNGNIVTTSVEHKAVLDAAESMTNNEIIYIQPNRFGQVTSEQIESRIDKNTKLVSVISTNNEIGTDNNLNDILEVLSDEIVFHTDATQSLTHDKEGLRGIGLLQERVDMLSVSAHKFHGPKGVGLLIANKKTQDNLFPIIHGGNHERGLRSGTLNVPGIVGLAEALKIQNECEISVEKLRIEFEEQLVEKLPEEVKYSINGMRPTSPIFQKEYGVLEKELSGHPGNISITFEDIQATSIIAGVPELAVSTGSACTSEIPSPSHVLQEIGLSLEEARSTIRISLSRFTKKEEVKDATDMITGAVKDYLERI